MSEEFQTQKCRRHRRTKAKRLDRTNIQRTLEVSDEKDPLSVLLGVHSRKSSMKNSEFITSFDEIMTSTYNLSPVFSRNSLVEIVCYGLGKFSSCVDACYQLCLLLHLKSIFPESRVLVFDPIFSDCEIAVLKQLNLEVMNVNEEAKRTVKLPTIFFAPHCSKSLYNNILWANWSIPLLMQIIIIGNSFSEMEGSLPRRLLTKHFSCLSSISSVVSESCIPNTFSYETVFNNLSVHTFLETNLGNLEDGVWDKPEKIVYEPDDELILNKEIQSM